MSLNRFGFHCQKCFIVSCAMVCTNHLLFLDKCSLINQFLNCMPDSDNTDYMLRKYLMYLNWYVINMCYPWRGILNKAIWHYISPNRSVFELFHCHSCEKYNIYRVLSMCYITLINCLSIFTCLRGWGWLAWITHQWPYHKIIYCFIIEWRLHNISHTCEVLMTSKGVHFQKIHVASYKQSPFSLWRRKQIAYVRTWFQK